MQDIAGNYRADRADESCAVQDFALLEGALSSDDIAALRTACKRHLDGPDAIPSYVLLDACNSEPMQKIKRAMEDRIGEKLLYLNDFYLFTDDTFQADWHVDTEMFTFDRSFNAWILLSPDHVESPLAVMADRNRDGDAYFHAVKVDDGRCEFVNYANGSKHTTALDAIETSKIEAPAVTLGDILILNPKRFHRTNVMAPKHVLAIKFLAEGDNGLLSPMQVPGMLWRETKFFNDLVKSAASWDDVIDGIRRQLTTAEGRKALSAGFFPEKLELYSRKVREL